MYQVKMTLQCEKRFKKIIPIQLQNQILSRMQGLAKNPYLGKPLGYRFIRELKAGKFRLYFLIFEKEIMILFVDISDKKNQQKVIESINEHRELFKEIVKNLKKDEI